jgi:TolB-like protein
MYKKSIRAILILVLVTLAGCGSGIPTESFVRENTNLGLIQTIAVMPFEGGGRAPRIRELTMTQLLSTEIFDVVDKARVDVFLQQEALPPGAPMDVSTLRRLGETLDVQAVLLGSVEQVAESRGSSSFLEITMTLRLVQCDNGQLLWQASGVGSGYSLADRLFGFTPRDTFEVIMELLDELFATMYVAE